MKTKQEGPASAPAVLAPGSDAVAAAAKPKVEDVIAVDEHAGKGGSFVFDSLTGARVPSDETAAQWAAADLAAKGRAVTNE